MSLFNLFASKAYDETTEQVNEHYKEAIAANAPLEKVYKAARPVLFFAGTLAIIPQEWRQVLVCLIHILDQQVLPASKISGE